MTGFNLGADRVAAIALSVLGEPNRRLSGPRELRWGARGSLAVIPARGVFFDNESGARGGVLDLLVYAGAARDRFGAAQLLKTDGDLPTRETPEQRQERREAQARRQATRMAVAADLWRTGAPVANTAAEAYLRRARAISAPLDSSALRFASAAPLRPYAPDERASPALLARVVNGAGAPIGLHLTYVRPDGSGKANVATPRKMVGLVGGGHVRLIPGAALVVGEGLESTFSAWEVVAGERGAPRIGASAALSANGVATFVWPSETRELVIAPDRDPGGAGERAARELGRRAHAAALNVGLLWPPEGASDWNSIRTAEASR